MVATKPVDFRKGHDGLAALVKNELHKDPFTGTVFVFRSRKADRLKLIYWDGSGLAMVYKRLEEHTFTWPDIRDGLMTLGHAQFEALFAGLDWRRVRSVETRAPTAIEYVRHDDSVRKLRQRDDAQFDKLPVCWMRSIFQTILLP